jgi:3-deoxy-D-manno-octulosonic-acid transferase
VLAASTREGEEAPLLAAWQALPAPRPLLLVVPRHPQRFDEVATLIERAGFSLARRSAWTDVPQAPQADVWLGDSIGEMALYGACADVALLGGSYAPLGGQNLIELAACGTPVVLGPSTFNFAEAAERAVEARAALRVANIDDGVRAAVAIACEGDRTAWRERALGFAAAHRGATERTAQRIVELIDAPAAG